MKNIRNRGIKAGDMVVINQDNVVFKNINVTLPATKNYVLRRDIYNHSNYNAYSNSDKKSFYKKGDIVKANDVIAFNHLGNKQGLIIINKIAYYHGFFEKAQKIKKRKLNF